MVACGKTKLTHPLYSYGRQSKNDIAIVRVSEGIDYLSETSTKTYQEILKGKLSSFDPITTPKDLIRCNENSCHMTGTLWVSPEEIDQQVESGAPAKKTKGISVKYRIRGDYSQAAFGLSYLYLSYLGSDNLIVKATVSDYSDYEQTNSYTYQDEVSHYTRNANDFVVAQFDFADPNKIKAQTGTGWTPGVRGITVTYEILHKNPDDSFKDNLIGISNIKTICSRSELHKADNVLLSCMDGFSIDSSVDATDAKCFGANYDSAKSKIESTIKAVTRSTNDWWLNPFESRGDITVTGIPETRTFEVKEKVVSGVTFGYFEISDLYAGCNSVIISLGNDCQGFYLEPLSSPRISTVAPEEFITLYNKNDDFGGTYLNKEHIGKTVLVTYDREREVTHIKGSEDKLDEFEAEFIIPIKSASNKKETYLKFYALITSHKEEWKRDDEAEIEIKLSYLRRNGKFYDKFIVE